MYSENKVYVIFLLVVTVVYVNAYMKPFFSMKLDKNNLR